jgi:hypothetical protein
MVIGALSIAPDGLMLADSPSKPRGGAAPVLDEDLARRAGLSAGEVKDAARLYTAKCMRCHKSYDPAAYADPQWNIWMIKMRKKAHLGPEQEKLLSRYLEAYRSGQSIARTNAIASGSSEPEPGVTTRTTNPTTTAE